jgi:ATP-dependent DNA ligase
MSSRKDPNISQIQLDLVVMGAKRGVGVNNRDRFASFLLGTPYQGRIVPISFVGSGFTAEMLNIITEYIKDRRLEVETIPVEYDMWRTTVDTCFRPDMVFEVHAQEFTVSSMHKLGDTGYGGLSLRFPIFKCIREDKGVGESSTGEEIL